MARVARAMAMATERVMVTSGDNMDNGNSKEGGGQATAATMAMGRGAAQRTWLLMLKLERGG
jgi:hypothetical protein